MYLLLLLLLISAMLQFFTEAYNTRGLILLRYGPAWVCSFALETFYVVLNSSCYGPSSSSL